MAAHTIFSPAHRDFIRNCYLRSEMQPATIHPMLNEKYGTNYTLVQVQRLINNKWSKKRKVMLERIRTIETKTDGQIVKSITRKHAQIMDRFAGKSEKLADKALDMANSSSSPRSMAAAASAAKSAITMFRVCTGIDKPGTGPTAATFNFNFSAIRPIKDGEEPAAPVEVQAIEASSPGDEDDDDDSYDEEDDVRV
jgi:hypothetical protein